MEKKRPTIHVIAQSHIDLAWLWKWDPETIQTCCKITFGQATENLDRFSDYYFSQSQAPLYIATEQHHPQIFSKMEKYIKEGRWEIVGGMYVEAEGGEPGGEAVVRQVVMGKRYFQQRFNINVTTGWQEDSWAHPWQLPQIYAKCGINAYFYKRGRRPAQIFWWQGPDGSRILVIKPIHLLTGGAQIFDRLHLNWWIRRNLKEYHLSDIMVRIGKGDHGGGPNPAQIKKLNQFAQHNRKKIEIKFDSFKNYVAQVLDKSVNLPVLNTEIGNELQGDLTNCCEIKQRNRFSENLLLTTEKLETLAWLLTSHPYHQNELEKAWRNVLFNQFHDIIGGSCIPEENVDVHKRYDETESICQLLKADSLKVIISQINIPALNSDAIPFLLINPLSSPRVDLFILSISFKNPVESLEIYNVANQAVPFQILTKIQDANQCNFTILGQMPIQSYGYNLCYVIPRKITTDQHVSDSNCAQFHENIFENEFFRIEIDEITGNITQIEHKPTHRNVLDSQKRGNCLVCIDDMGDSEGRFKLHSDIFPKPLGKRHDITFLDSERRPGQMVLKENGSLRCILSIHKAINQSTFEQQIILYRTIPRIDFRLIMEWHDTHKMLKILFPFSMPKPEVTYSAPYGSIVHPADGIEYPMQSWIDLSTQTYGISLLNNTRYAADVLDSAVGISVLRSPTTPALNSDQGHHEFNYALYTHEGSWKHSDIFKYADEFQNPVIVSRTTPNEGSWKPTDSFFSVNNPGVRIEVVKKAYDSEAIVLRLYEVFGENCQIILHSAFAIKKINETDMLEQLQHEISVEKDRIAIEMHPYEIKTLKLEIEKNK